MHGFYRRFTLLCRRGSQREDRGKFGRGTMANRSLWLGLFLLVAFAGPSVAESVFHVSVTGNDMAAGSAAAPLELWSVLARRCGRLERTRLGEWWSIAAAMRCVGRFYWEKRT